MKIVGMGDSLMQYNGDDTYPQEGWPQELGNFLKPGVEIKNFAKNGRSSKSFIDEGLYEKALESLEEGDIALVSFGHNDEKKEDPTRYLSPSDYEENLVRMGKDIKQKKATPIYISSLSRLKVEQGRLIPTHGEYPSAMKRAAERLGAPFVPLDEISFREFGKDPEQAKAYFMILSPGQYPNYPDGQDDHTHLQQCGAKYVASIIAQQLRKISVCEPLFAGGKES